MQLARSRRAARSSRTWPITVRRPRSRCWRSARCVAHDAVGREPRGKLAGDAQAGAGAAWPRRWSAGSWIGATAPSRWPRRSPGGRSTPDVAKLCIRTVRSSGRPAAGLVDALAKAGGLDGDARAA